MPYLVIALLASLISGFAANYLAFRKNRNRAAWTALSVVLIVPPIFLLFLPKRTG